jgi:hypothetical protein
MRTKFPLQIVYFEAVSISWNSSNNNNARNFKTWVMINSSDLNFGH